jgi:hypothetical protein
MWFHTAEYERNSYPVQQLLDKKGMEITRSSIYAWTNNEEEIS